MARGSGAVQCVTELKEASQPGRTGEESYTGSYRILEANVYPFSNLSPLLEVEGLCESLPEANLTPCNRLLAGHGAWG